MDVIKMRTVVEILKCYYEKGMSQEEIAQKQHMSKSKVNRTIKKAISAGYIKLKIDYPVTPVQDLEETFKKEFGLQKAFIAPVVTDDMDMVCNDVCRALAKDLPNIIKDNDIIGISWGNTVKVLASCLEKVDRNNIKVVQLNGGISKNTKSTNALEILERFTNAFNGEGYVLPLPAIVDSRQIVDVLKQDLQISNVFNLMQKCNVAIFGIGSVSYDSVLYSANYFKKDEYDELQKKGTVGDICSRYYDINGKIVDTKLDARTIGISRDEIRKKDYSIGVVVGEEKAKAILGALNGGYINTLYSDENTARRVLKIYYSQLSELSDAKN